MSNGTVDDESDEVDSDDEKQRKLIAVEHDAMVEDYGIRSLRNSSFFIEQESGLKQKHLGGLIPIIRHSSKSRLRWDALVMFMVIYSSFQIPYDATFRTEIQPLLLAVVETTVDVLFALDILFNFRTTYVDELEQIEIFSGRDIAEHYLNGFFAIDLLATIPFDSLFENAEGISLTWLNALKMIRLLRLGRLLKKLDDVTAAGLFRLFRIVLGILLLLHWLACALRILVSAENNTRTPTIWGDSHIIEGAGAVDTDFDLYSAFLYSTIQMLFRSTDEHPHTTAERVYMGMVTIFGSCLQAILFGSVAVLISSFDASQVEYDGHSTEVVRRLKNLQVPRPIIKRTKKFLDLLWTNQRSSNVSVDDFLTSLSPVLSTEIKMALYLKKITSTPFFEACGREVLIALANCVNTRVYMAGDRVCRRGEHGSWMAFIAKGSVSVLVESGRKDNHLCNGGGDDDDGNGNGNGDDDGSGGGKKEEKNSDSPGEHGIQNEKEKREEKKQKDEDVSALPPNEKEVAILREGPGGYFGEMALIYNRPRNATIQARSWLRIHQLFRRDYLNTFQLYPNEKKKMDEVVGRMKLFQSLKVVKAPPGKRASKGGEFSFEQSVSETMVNKSHQ